MDRDKFRNTVDAIYEYHGKKKMPSWDQLEMWFQDLQHINDRAVEWIGGKMRFECDAPFRNFPKIFNEYYFRWQNENAGNRPEHKEIDCPECKGKGFLWYIIPEGDIPYEYSSPCRFCENWRAIYPMELHIPALSKQEIIARGWILSGPSGVTPEATGPKDIRKILGRIG